MQDDFDIRSSISNGTDTNQVHDSKHNYKKQKSEKKILFGVSALIIILIVGVVINFVYYKDSPIEVDDSLAINQDELLDIRYEEADDTVFDYGAFPKDEIIDTTTYDIPTAEENLSLEFVDVINNSPTYSGLESVYEILDFDDFDKDGDIKEEVMREIIAGARGEVQQ
jgi:hypothetical protein